MSLAPGDEPVSSLIHLLFSSYSTLQIVGGKRHLGQVRPAVPKSVYAVDGPVRASLGLLL